MANIKNHKFKGTDTFKEMVSSFDNIIVYFDPDVDGMVAGLLVCRYLSIIGKTFQWYVNSNRSHDWSLPIEKLKGRDIIAVDFMIPKNCISDIVKSGSNIVSMDHHINQSSFIDIKFRGKRGVVINNHYPFEDADGRYLSGAGVVFETLRHLHKGMDTEENRALVGLTLLSDVCDIENPLAKGYLTTLYNHKYKGYIKYLIESTIGDKDYRFGVPRLDRKYVDFKFSPAINACLRFNKEDDVVNFFLGKKKLDLGYHKRQKALVESMLSVVKVREYSNLRVVFVKEWEIVTDEDLSVVSNFVGLLASRFLDGKKSVIAYAVGREDDKPVVRRASFRGNINGVDYLSSVNTLVTSVGHPSAFGVIGLTPNKEFFNNMNTLCKEAEGNSTNSKDITPVTNLSIFSNRDGRHYAEFNMYCLSQHSKYLRYVGKNIKERRSGAKFAKYLVDGVEVTSFNPELNFSNGLIYPVLERGFIYYYLQEEI